MEIFKGHIPQVMTDFAPCFGPAPTHPLPRMVKKPICGLGEKWSKMRICCRFRFLAQVVHVLCPNFFLPSQVTRQATFGEKFFFRLTFQKKFFALENFRKFRLKKISTNEIGGMRVRERAEFSLTKPHHIPLPTTRILLSYNKLVKKMIFTPTFFL